MSVSVSILVNDVSMLVDEEAGNGIFSILRCLLCRCWLMRKEYPGSSGSSYAMR